MTVCSMLHSIFLIASINRKILELLVQNTKFNLKTESKIRSVLRIFLTSRIDFLDYLYKLLFSIKLIIQWIPTTKSR